MDAADAVADPRAPFRGRRSTSKHSAAPKTQSATMLSVREATVRDLLAMQQTNLWRAPEWVAFLDARRATARTFRLVQF